MTHRRFCFVTTFYPPYSFGGDAVTVQRLAGALSRRGHDVTVVHDADTYRVLHRGPAPSAAPEQDGVKVITLRTRLPLANVALTLQAGRPILNAARLSQILAPGQFDVIVFNNISLVGGPGVLKYGGDAARVYLAHEHWLVCPTHVLWRHGQELCDGRECVTCQIRHKRPPQLWRHTGLLERNAGHVDAFVAFSEFSRRKHAEFGFPFEMDVLPGFVPEPPAAVAGEEPSHPRPYFLFAGRLEKIKGVQDVIPAFARDVDADLLIAGDGAYGERLRALAAGSPRVKFLGRVPPGQLHGLYRNALAVLVPSLCFETFGLVLIEAFSHGTPVVARRLGPFPEIVDRARGGLLFASYDELVTALQRLQRDAAHRAALGEQARAAHAAHWTEDAVLPQFMRIVARAESRRASRVPELMTAPVTA